MSNDNSCLHQKLENWKRNFLGQGVILDLFQHQINGFFLQKRDCTNLKSNFGMDVWKRRNVTVTSQEFVCSDISLKLIQHLLFGCYKLLLWKIAIISYSQGSRYELSNISCKANILVQKRFVIKLKELKTQTKMRTPTQA